MDNDTSRTGSSPGATGEQVLDQLRGLRRSSDDKVLAGVCGGLGRSLGVDPLLLRVVVAVMVLFGGTGIVLYALAWLLLPQDDGTASVGAQALDRGRHHPSTQTIWLAVVLAVAVTLGVVGAFGRWDGPILLSLAVVGLLVWLLRSGRVQTAGTPVPPSGAPVPPVPPAAAAGTAPMTATVQDTPTSTVPPVPPAPPAGPTWTAPVPPQPPAPPRPPKPRSHLFGLTVSVALIGVGVLAAIDAAGAHLWSGAYPALVLAVLGGGLLVGAWYGRARGLVFWGLVLALVTTVTSVAGNAVRDVPNRTVDDTVAVTQVDQLPTADRYGAGQVTYDLSGLDVAGQSVSMRSRIGFGEIVVVVPPDVDVTLDARTGVGGLSLFGQETGGVNDHVQRTDLGADGPGGGSLDLTLYAGFGHLEVRRATA
ncbi:hypothetical protein GCM10027446_24610 [Angustibacter peucedani]